MLLGVLLLIYLACAWRQAPALWMLFQIDAMVPAVFLLMATGTAFLVLGVARSLLNARLGQYFLMLAAIQFVMAAPQIGNWGYRLSQLILVTLLFGIGIALFGACLAYFSRSKN